MMDKHVLIEREEYKELLKNKTQVEVVIRLLETDRFVTAEDIKVVLGVKRGEEA